jgi:hypothetical protein
MEPTPSKTRPGPASKLTPLHIRYLVDRGTLQGWAAKSLAERVTMFHRKFGEVKISPATLLKVYKQHHIKRKGLKYVKTLKIKNPERRGEEISIMKGSVSESITSGRKLIFADEAVFATATFLDRGYTLRGENVHIEEKLVSSPALAVVAGVSAEGVLKGSTCKRAR